MTRRAGRSRAARRLVLRPTAGVDAKPLSAVMPALVAGIHVFVFSREPSPKRE
jgi:hypothetical protein